MGVMKIKTRVWTLFVLFSLVFAFEKAAAQAPRFLKRHEIALQGSTNKRSLASIQDTLSLVGQWGWGECYAVSVRDHYLFVGNGSLLQVYDVSDPVNLKEIGEIDVGNPITGLVLSGNYAYASPGLYIIDISDPTHLRLVSSLQIPALDGAIAVNGNYAYLGDFYGAIYTIDISNPSQPFVVNGHPMIYASGGVGSIVVVDTILYAGSGEIESYPVIYNISNEMSPVKISSSFGFWGPLAQQGHYLYLGAGHGADELCIYDITNLTNPRWVNGADLRADPLSITIKDTLAFVWEEYDGFEVVDIADTSDIYVLAHEPYLYNFPEGVSGPVDGCFDSTTAFIAGINGLWTVDVGNLPAVTSLSFLGTGYADMSSISTDTSNHAFLSEMYGGLKIIDFTDPSSPQLVGQYDPDEKVRNVVASGDKAYVLCDSDMVILDVSDISNPTVIGKVAFGDTINDDIGLNAFGALAVLNSTVYVARSSKILYAVDVSIPSSPVIKDSESTPGVPLTLAKSGNYLYVADFGLGIQVLNINKPFQLEQSGFIKVSGMGGLLINGEDLFLSADSVFSIYRIMDSLDLQLVGRCNGVTSLQVANANNFSYTTDGNNFYIIDVRDPASPFVVYSYPMLYQCVSLASYGNLVFLARHVNSLLIMANNLVTKLEKRPSGPQVFDLYQNYPNPFNPSTNIGFQIPKAGMVILRVHDILGREIATLINQKLQAGNYSVSFSNTKLASGVYFYSLSLNGEMITRKMEFLK